MLNPNQRKKLIKTKLIINLGQMQLGLDQFRPSMFSSPRQTKKGPPHTKSWAQGPHMVKSILELRIKSNCFMDRKLTSDFLLNMMSFRTVNFSNFEILRTTNFSNLVERISKKLLGH